MRRVLPLLVILSLGLSAACGGGGSGASSAYCKQLKDTAKEAADRAKQTGTSTTVNYTAIKDTFDKGVAKLKSKAPSELKDDYGVLTEYFDLYLDALSNPAKADRTKLTELGNKYRDASKNISDYNTKVCKYTTTTLGSSATTRATTSTTAATTTTKK